MVVSLTMHRGAADGGAAVGAGVAGAGVGAGSVASQQIGLAFAFAVSVPSVFQ